MTKIKNTKKGMAKKTLSISLAVAMLATSNVPVWAAEFTDGTDAAFTSEVEVPVEVVDEAPVVEEEAPVVDAESAVTGVGYDITTTPFANVSNGEVVWSDGTSAVTVTTEFTVTENDDKTDGATLHYVWKDSKGQVGQIVEGTFGKSMEASIALNADMCNEQYKLYVYAKKDNTVVWDWTSDAFTVKPIDITQKVVVQESEAFTSDFKTTYTGKDIIPTINQINVGTILNKSDASKTYGLDAKNIQIGSTKGDTVNVTDDGVDVYLSSTQKGYTGNLIVNYKIDPLALNTNADAAKYLDATFVTTSKPYTGNMITLKNSDIKVVDKKSGVDLSSYIEGEAEDDVIFISANDAKGGKQFNTGKADSNLTFKLETPAKSTYKNYTIGTNVTLTPSNTFTIDKRDLSTVNVSIPEQDYDSGNLIVVDPVKDNVSFYDKTTGESLNLGEDVVITSPSNATSNGEYEVTVTPKTNNTNVEGSTTAKLYIASSSLDTAEFSNMPYATLPEEYTGERILKDLDKLGTVKITDNQGVRNLLPSDYTVEFGTNINAGYGTVIIKGKQGSSYYGSRKAIAFPINNAKVTKDTVTVSEYIEVKDTTKAEDYKDAMNLVVKAKNGAGKEFTLTEGTDYVVEKYELVDKNKDDKYEAGDEVKVTLKVKAAKAMVAGKEETKTVLKNKNFIAEAYTFTSTLTDRVLKPENIKLKKDSYTYTGVVVQPEFDVVVDGRIISPDRYTIVTNTENINVGTAKLTITGVAGQGFSDKVNASVNFEITPANAADLKGTIASRMYTGYSIEPGADDVIVRLNDVTINTKDNFTLSYGENVKIGEGTVVLTPKNKNFTGTKTVTFKITGQMLKGGVLKYYDKNGLKTTLGHTYDGTAYTAAKTVFDTSSTVLTKPDKTTATGPKLVEGTDYEIKYVDNVYGKKIGTGTNAKQMGAVLVIAKGSYAGNYENASMGIADGIYTDAAGNKIGNVIFAEAFNIAQKEVKNTNVSVSNGTYAGGLPVKPVVVVNVENKTLVEGVDYELKYDTATEATTTNSLNVTVIPKNGYKTSPAFTNTDGTSKLTFNWGVDKFDLANADVTVKDNGATVIVKCGRVDIATSDYVVTKDEAANTVTVTAKENSKNYKGSKTVSAVVITPEEKPETPVIEKVNVSGNKATVVLSGESEGAVGYDYVISTDKDCINNKDYDKVNKNILNTTTDFTYVGQDVYYAYCHAWKRGEDGKKIFSDWSNAYPFVVSAITPSQPAITSVKVKGSTVTVTYTKSSNADGYDVVLGSKVATVAGEKRPVEYGKLVKKNIKGNTVTATFKNVKKGTYYVGLHAFNRTSEDGKKVFSPWSNVKKVTVK